MAMRKMTVGGDGPVWPRGLTDNVPFRSQCLSLTVNILDSKSELDGSSTDNHFCPSHNPSPSQTVHKPVEHTGI